MTNILKCQRFLERIKRNVKKLKLCLLNFENHEKLVEHLRNLFNDLSAFIDVLI